MKLYIEFDRKKILIAEVRKNEVVYLHDESYPDPELFSHPRVLIPHFNPAEEYLRDLIFERVFNSFLSRLTNKHCVVNLLEEDLEGGITDSDKRAISELFLRIGMHSVHVISDKNISKDEILNLKYS